MTTKPKAAPRKPKQPGALRIVAMHLQPELVFDDGEALTPIPVGAMRIEGHKWPAYSGAPWRKVVRDLEKRIQAEGLEAVLAPPAE